MVEWKQYGKVEASKLTAKLSKIKTGSEHNRNKENNATNTKEREKWIRDIENRRNKFEIWRK